jgi:hypothetical protein
MKSFWLAALLCVSPALADVSTIEVKREVQLTDSLCWAAVSTMAVRAFETSNSAPVTQLDIVVYRQAGIKTRQDLIDRDEDLVAARDDCDPLAQCDGVDNPWLFDLNSTKVAAGKVLTERHFRRDIKVRKRPIIIQWDYSDADGLADDTPQARHVLIVTGYNDADPEHMLRVWDPWPTVERADEATEPVGREKWISYDTYVDPGSDHGLKAVHGFDEYKLRRVGQAAPAGYPALANPPQRQVSGPPINLSFRRSLVGARDAIGAHMRDMKVYARDGSRMAGPFTAADAFPIVVLTTGQILRARDRPQALLAEGTETLLVPVLASGQVVDSFLMQNENGNWFAGGYSNNRIAQVMVELRERFTNNARQPSEFYMVSVPEEGAFFVAHGFNLGAQLVSVNNDGTGGLLPAEEALGRVLLRIDTQRTRRGATHIPPPTPTDPTEH